MTENQHIHKYICIVHSFITRTFILWLSEERNQKSTKRHVTNGNEIHSDETKSDDMKQNTTKRNVAKCPTSHLFWRDLNYWLKSISVDYLSLNCWRRSDTNVPSILHMPGTRCILFIKCKAGFFLDEWNWDISFPNHIRSREDRMR